MARSCDPRHLMTAQNKAEAKQIPMNILMQTAVLLLICFAGEGISLVLPFAFPSSVISMILLFILLATKIVKLKQIEEVTGFLTKNMAFFFLPAGVVVPRIARGLTTSRWWFVVHAVVQGGIVVVLAIAGFSIAWAYFSYGLDTPHRVSG